MEKKFQRGDIIVGNFRNKYGITKRGTKCRVVEVDFFGGGEDLRVEVIEGADSGYKDTVESKYFDLVQRSDGYNPLGLKKVASKPNAPAQHYQQPYTIDHDENLGATFIRVGDVTIAVPVPEKMVSITVKHPQDVECDEIAKAVAYYRMAKGARK